MSVSEIADQEGIPYAFARSIQHDLVKSSLIKTVRGAHGGLILNCDPAKTTMLDLLEAVQGPVSVAACAMDPYGCARHETCVYNKVWQGADRLLNSYFSSITLEDLFTLGAGHPTVVSALAVGPSGRDEECPCNLCAAD